MSNETRDDFQIGVECIAEANRRYWENDVKTVDGEGWIYVIHTTHHQFISCVRESLAAKGLQGKTNLPIVSVISGRADELMDLTDQLDESLGIKQRLHPSYYDYSSKEIENIAKKMAFETYGNKDGLISLTYRDVRFGNILYNDIIRRGNHKKLGEVFDCFDISQERYRVFIRNALAIIDQAYAMFEVRKPKYVIMTEFFYTKALYIHVASVLGVKIIITSAVCPDILVEIDSRKHQFSDITWADIKRIEMVKSLQKYQINHAESANLFVLEASNKPDPLIPEGWKNKKNVFILPHAIGDSPRTACKHYLYHDYNEWFLETLKIVRTIPGVNWIVKDHLCASYYKQENHIKAIFEKYKSENMYWIDRNYDGSYIKNFADCVITCAGNVGIEYWACGIPTITTGGAYYCNWGISHSIKSIEEYERTLKNIGHIGKPSQESSKLARNYLLANNNYHNQCDLFSKLLYDSAMADMSIWAENGNFYGTDASSDQQIGKVIRSFCESFAALLQKHDFRQSSLYQLENLVDL